MEAGLSKIAVMGPGLLGGSIARAIRERMPGCDLRLWARREEPLDLARQQGITQHTSTNPMEAVRGAELIILATPIAVFEDLSRRMLPAIDRGAIVTDVGSVKAYVHRTTGATLTERGRIFIGSHPMAGTEKQGLEHSDAGLLQGATVALTNPHGAAECHVERLETFWQTLGCKTYRMNPTHHDQAVARISHMPHILAALCARGAVAGETPTENLQRLAASGFRDTTRVCEGPARMWADILWENDVAVRRALADCIRDLHCLSDLLENQDRQGVQTWLEEARAARQMVRQQ